MCLAIPGKILSVNGTDPLWREGRVDFSGVIKTVNLACAPEAGVGNYVLVHAGMAISVVDEDEARAVLEHFRAMGESVTSELGEGSASGEPDPPTPGGKA